MDMYFAGEYIFEVRRHYLWIFAVVDYGGRVFLGKVHLNQQECIFHCGTVSTRG